MPNWNEILDELKQSMRIDKLDHIRSRYIKKYHEKTGKNVICYYSGFLQKPNVSQIEIIDNDKNGFMTCVSGLDKSQGLDLFLHTPGGQIAATESLVHYLRKMFGNNIRAIIPQIAMSAGTMIACSCKEIVMGKQSNIGPIDPQFNGIPAQGVLSEFKRAVKEAKEKPETIPLWQTIISKYNPSFIGECQNAVNLSKILVKKWLFEGMFESDPEKSERTEKILNLINSHEDTMTHSRHLHIDDVKEVGLKVKSIEDDFDDEYQDLVLTIHHCFMHTFQQSTSIKIIENHNKQRMVQHAQQQIMQQQLPFGIKNIQKIEPEK